MPQEWGFGHFILFWVGTRLVLLPNMPMTVAWPLGRINSSFPNPKGATINLQGGGGRVLGMNPNIFFTVIFI